MVITRLTRYSLLCSGWGRYKKYAFLGMMRSAFGSVRFEACFMCVVIFCSLFYRSYCLCDYFVCGYRPLLVFPVLYVLFLICVLCETNRTPFDYAESEREFVRGYNVEYGGVLFICLFACEYVVIFIFSWLLSVRMYGGGLLGWVFMCFHLMVFM